MHNKSFEIIILLYLFFSFCIPESLGIFRGNLASSKLLNASSWSVSLNQYGINNSLEVVPGGVNDTYVLKVVSDSEVNTIYSIIVSNIPSDVLVKLDNGSFQPYSSTVTFSDAGTINYTGSSEERIHTLTFKATSGASLINNQTINVDVDFRQN